MPAAALVPRDLAETSGIITWRRVTLYAASSFSCTMRVDCGQFDPARWSGPENGARVYPSVLDEEDLADWRAGRNAVYQFAALTIGSRIAVADA